MQIIVGWTMDTSLMGNRRAVSCHSVAIFFPTFAGSSSLQRPSPPPTPQSYSKSCPGSQARCPRMSSWGVAQVMADHWETDWCQQHARHWWQKPKKCSVGVKGILHALSSVFCCTLPSAVINTPGCIAASAIHSGGSKWH